MPSYSLGKSPEQIPDWAGLHASKSGPLFDLHSRGRLCHSFVVPYRLLAPNRLLVGFREATAEQVPRLRQKQIR